MDVAIRVFQARQPKPLLQIYNKARLALGCFLKPKVSVQDFSFDIWGEKIYTAEIKGKIIGYISINETNNFIHHLYLLPKYSGYGIGKALLRCCKKNHGLPLSLKCLKDNQRACAFYENQGFKRASTGVSDEGFYNLYRLG